MNKNIFNNFLIAESCRTRTHLFQKLPSPAPESRNAPMLHRLLHLISNLGDDILFYIYTIYKKIPFFGLGFYVIQKYP